MPDKETMGEDELEEGSHPQEEEHLKVTEFIALEDEIKQKISTEVDPIAKANMEWELTILHSANMQFFQYGDAYNYYHLPTLPLPLLKMENQACAMKLMPKVPNKDLGGWDDIDLIAWHKLALLAHQLEWRINWFCKHPNNIIPYAQAPRDL